MKYFYVLLILLFVGCATEGKRKSDAQYLSPDKFKLQLNYNTDHQDSIEGHEDIDQIRFGLEWNL
tara:strand:- start:62 stop:256 length:195 start_codon:yes stop_codon:yes gene_type:complete